MPPPPSAPAARPPVAATRHNILQLLALSRQGRPWEFLAAVAPVPLADRPPELWHALAANAAALGLAEPAREALARSGAAPSDPLFRTIAAIPPSHIAPESLRATLEANLAARPGLAAALAPAREAWDRVLHTQRWYRATDGNIARLDAGADHAHTWHGRPIACTDARAAALALIPKPDPDRERATPPLCYLEGASPPWLLIELARTRYTASSLGASARLLLVQADESAFLDALAHADLRDILAQPRLECFVGPDAGGRLAARLSQLGRTALTGIGLLTPGTRARCEPNLQTIVNTALAQQRARLSTAKDRVLKRLAGRDAAWWADRYRAAGPTDPLRVLILTSRYSTYIGSAGRDLAGAFTAAGCRAELFIEPDDHANITAVGLYETLDTLDPDLIVIFNYPRRTLALGVPDAIPLLCWIQDPMPHLFDAANFTSEPSRSAALDYYIGHDHPDLRALGLDPRRLLACPVLASERVFTAPGRATDCLASRALGPRDLVCDIAIVTNHGQPPHLYFHDLCDSSGIPAAKRDAVVSAMAPLEPLINDPMSGSLRRAIPAVASKIASILDGGPDTAPLVRRHFVAPITDRIIRHTTAHWAADLARDHGLRLHIHGRGWDRAPGFEAFARGPAEHGPALRDVYATAGVTLHASLAWPVHQRVLETALSGGLPAIYLKADDLQTLQGLVARGLSDTTEPSHSNLTTRITIARAIDHPAAALATAMLQRLGAWLPAPPPSPGLSAQGFVGRYPWTPRDERTTSETLAGPFAEAALLGDLEAIGFNSKDRLHALIRRAADPAWRAHLSTAIADRARGAFTYEAAAARIPAFIAAHLAGSPSSVGPVCNRPSSSLARRASSPPSPRSGETPPSPCPTSSPKPQASSLFGSLPPSPRTIACIIPAYNAATTIERTLRSLQAQTLTDWHAVIVDDGSTDATAAIAAAFVRDDPRFALLTKPNAGVASARNAGLALARAAYTHQLDADDWLAPTAYAALTALAQRTGEPAAAGSFDVTNDRAEHGGDPIYRHTLARERIDHADLLAGVQLWTGAHIVRTDLAQATPYDESLTGYEDIDCWIRLAATGVRWACTTEPVAFHRIRVGSLTKRCADMIACGQRVLAAHGAGAAALTGLALAYATARALDPDAGAPVHAADLYRHAAGPKRLSPEAAANAARFAVIYHLGIAPALGVPEASRWLPRIRAWWQRAAAEGWAERDLPDRAALHLVIQLLDPAEVSARLLEGLDPSTPIVVIAHGRNGRALARAALDRGHAVQVRDDRYDREPDQAAGELPTGATLARVDDPIPQGAAVILTPIDDAALAARFPPDARRWSRVLAEWTFADAARRTA